MNNTSKRFSDNEKCSGVLVESLNLNKAPKAFIIYCNQKDFPRTDRERLVSTILKGPSLDFWMENIEERAECSKLAVLLKAPERQFETQQTKNKLRLLLAH